MFVRTSWEFDYVISFFSFLIYRCLKCLRKFRHRNKTSSNVYYRELHESNMDKHIFLFFCVCLCCVFILQWMMDYYFCCECCWWHYYKFFYFNELDLIYELMMLKWRGRGKWVKFDAMSLSKKQRVPWNKGKTIHGWKHILWWPKNVVTNIIFWNCATFNFHQANNKRGFHKLYSK
jgi:hypothetical protein